MKLMLIAFLGSLVLLWWLFTRGSPLFWVCALALGIFWFALILGVVIGTLVTTGGWHHDSFD